jgi:DNA-binding transcriptional LysR family regulator
MLSSKQIEIFYEVYKQNSASVAAQKLDISQPSVSKTLKTIESNIGYKLFIRKGKKLLPTQEAEALHEHASIVTSQIKNFNYIVNTYKSRAADFINIGTTPSLANTIVPRIIKKYKETNPDTKFNLINLNSIDLIEDRYKPDIDITICFNAKDQNSFNNIVLKEGKHCLVSAKKYNLAKKISLEEITDLPYIEITNLLSVYAKSSIMHFLIENEINMNFYLKTDSYTSALALINQGIGVAIIDDNTIQNANLDLVNISKIKDDSFDYSINAIMKQNNPRDECNQFFNFLSLQN